MWRPGYTIVKVTLKFEPSVLDINNLLHYAISREPLFNGNDYISMQMFNKKQEGSKTSILVLVQAKNNPPFINISSNILFFNATYWKTHNEIPITSIAVGDPDERDVRGMLLFICYFQIGILYAVKCNIYRCIFTSLLKVFTPLSLLHVFKLSTYSFTYFFAFPMYGWNLCC